LITLLKGKKLICSSFPFLFDEYVKWMRKGCMTAAACAMMKEMATFSEVGLEI